LFSLVSSSALKYLVVVTWASREQFVRVGELGVTACESIRRLLFLS
jgi:hypothetical protein